MAHTKRMIAPANWKTGKKTKYWVVTQKPGRHAKDESFPLLVILRDVLGLAGTAREAKAILSSKSVLVDAKPCADAAFAVGLMDTVSIAGAGKHYRIVPDTGGLKLLEIPASEAEKKILKVIGKHTVKGGKAQITFHDGRTMVLSAEEAKAVKTGNSAVFNLKSGKVEKFLPLDRRTIALVCNGAHIGKMFEVSEVKAGSAQSKPTVLLEAGRKSLETLKDYVIAVGVGKPEITVALKKEAD